MRKGFIAISILFFLCTCSSNYSPKPRAYFYIDLPETVYHSIHSSDSSYSFVKNLPFELDVSDRIIPENVKDSLKTKWFNLLYPRFNARIYCTLFLIDKKNFQAKADETKKMAYFHEIKADGIEEQAYKNPEQKVYGLMYKIKGNVASPVQFAITDSTHHFFRGALYFDNPPNQDSIAPVLAYITKDIHTMMESFRWKQ